MTGGETRAADARGAGGGEDLADGDLFDDGGLIPGGLRRDLVELDRVEALRLLGSVSVGRIVFTERALPAVRPVNHVLDQSGVIIRTSLGAAITSAARKGVVVAYEADLIDPLERLGWSVIVTGYARLVRDADEIARYQRLVRPWADRLDKDQIIRIETDLVTGFVLVVAD